MICRNNSFLQEKKTRTEKHVADIKLQINSAEFPWRAFSVNQFCRFLLNLKNAEYTKVIKAPSLYRNSEIHPMRTEVFSKKFINLVLFF